MSCDHGPLDHSILIGGLRPDEQVNIDWNTVQACLRNVGQRLAGFEHPLLGDSHGVPRFLVRTFKQVISANTPLCQVADLFAGMTPYTYDRAELIRRWLRTKGGRQTTLDGFGEPQELQTQLNEWRLKGYSAQTCNLRRTALSHLFTMLDGKRARNPLVDVPKFERPEPKPHALPYEVIRATFDVMRPNATKARLMLMAFAGFRPSEIMRALPEDVEPFLDLPEPFCYKRTGKRGRPVMVPLPPEGVEAWRLFIERNAWGTFARENINRDWKAAMRRAGQARIEKLREERAEGSVIEATARAFMPVRCYSLRHSYATQLLLKGSDDLALVQEALGHRDARTTRIYTTVKVNPRLIAAVRKAFGT